MKKSIRLLVVGDENVGKSTLISTIYSELQTNIERTLRRVILPPEMCLYSKQIFTEIIDTSVDMDLKSEILQADLILLIYDISDMETITNIDGLWLPKIAAIKPKVPVILVGNKIDIKQHEFQSENQHFKVKDILKKVAKQYKNVQMGIQCSAFYDRNVRAVLNCAQRAVLYPLSPIYNLQNKQITQNFEKALIRIFRILDKDLDGKLYDQQLNSLQQRVFQSELNLEDIKAIKQIIIRQLRVDYHDYIELDGFIALQKKCIDMLKIQICWSILRYFHYDDDLRIIVSKNDHFQINKSESIQLSGEAIDFLLKLYNYARNQTKIQNKQDHQMHQQHEYLSRDHDNASDHKNSIIKAIFASSPWIRLPQFQLDGQNKNHANQQMSEQKFIVNWNLYAFMDYRKCYQDLLYLGYQKTIDETYLKKTQKKTYKNYEKLKQNKVISILIIDSLKYSAYIDSYFQDGETIFLSNGSKYMRNAYLHTVHQQSRVFILFRVNDKDIQTFFIHNEETKMFADRIDIILNWATNKQSNDICRNLPQTILYRVITKSEAQSRLETQQSLKLNLHNFPIRIHNEKTDKLFQIALQTCQEFDRYLSKETIQRLKIQQDRKNKVFGITAAVAICGLAVVGIIASKGNAFNKFWPK